MDTLRQALRNILAQSGAQMVTWTATLLFTASLGRYLGDTGFGTVYLALSFTGMFGVLVAFGLQPLVTRDIARDPDLLPRYLVNGLAITCALWGVSILGIWGSSLALGYPESTQQVLLIYSLTMGVTACSSLVASLYRGLSRLGHPSIATVIDKTLTAGVGIFLLSRGFGVIEVAWVVFFGALAGLAWQVANLPYRIRALPPIDRAVMRRMVVQSTPFVAYAVLGTICWQIDAVMLSKMTDEAVVGWYGAAYRLFETLLFLSTLIAKQISQPILARLSQSSEDALRVVLEKELTVLLVLGVPLCVGLIVLADPIIGFIFGSGFEASVPALRVLSVALLVVYVNTAIGSALVSLDRERWLPAIAAGTIVVNVGLNLLLIPIWQHVGAGVATVLTELAVGIGFLLLFPRHLLTTKVLGVATKAALAALAMAAVIQAVGAAPLAMLVLLGGVVYAPLALVLRAVEMSDVQMLLRAMGRGSARQEARPAGVGPE